MSNPFVGQIALFPYNFAPKNWLLCQGQLLSISQYSALFSLLGTYYGGDGTNTFALPDLQGRVPLHSDKDYEQGTKGGFEQVSLDAKTSSRHNHAFNATTDKATDFRANGNLLAQAVSGSRTSAYMGLIYSNNSNGPNVALNPATIGLTGKGAPHNNIQPYQVLSYCIAVAGVFPSRN